MTSGMNGGSGSRLSPTHVQNYPKWLDEGGRSIALREKVEDHLRVSGEMSPKRES